VSRLTEFDHDDEQALERQVQSTRWREVEAARQRVVDRYEAIDEAQFGQGKGLAQDRVSLLKQRAVQLYVLQVETVLNPVDGDTTPWWDEKPVGQFTLPDGRAVQVTGLKQYLDLDEEITITVEEHHKPHAAHVGEVRTVEKSVTPPVGLHRNAFQATNRGLADQGVDFDTRAKDIGEDDLGKANAV
jgi:hypothetical protein